MIQREHYLEQIRPFYDSDLIKIVTGIRRCGKSVLLNQVRKEIQEKTSNIIYLNFEDKITTSQIHNINDLLCYVQEHRKKNTLYLFLDEVQELQDWQEAVKTLRIYDTSIFITGSNSKLLSGEFTKELSGRYVAFRVRTFVYREMEQYAKELNKEFSISDYLIWGGFPGRLECRNDEAQRRYINDLDNTIVINDLIRRYKIRKTPLFTSLVNFVLRSNGRIFSANSVRKYIVQEHQNCSVNTIMKYLEHLEEAYIIEHIKPYSSKTKKELSFYQKIYNADVAFNSIRCPDNRYDLTHNLENIVYLELLYMGYTLKVYENKGKEIDFLCTKNGKNYYVQVAYSIAEDTTYEREFRAFDGINQADKKIIITNDDIDYSTSNIQHISLKNFLLLDDLS